MEIKLSLTAGIEVLHQQWLKTNQNKKKQNTIDDGEPDGPVNQAYFL